MQREAGSSLGCLLSPVLTGAKIPPFIVITWKILMIVSKHIFGLDCALAICAQLLWAPIFAQSSACSENKSLRLLPELWPPLIDWPGESSSLLTLGYKKGTSEEMSVVGLRGSWSHEGHIADCGLHPLHRGLATVRVCQTSLDPPVPAGSWHDSDYCSWGLQKDTKKSIQGL